MPFRSLWHADFFLMKVVGDNTNNGGEAVKACLPVGRGVTLIAPGETRGVNRYSVQSPEGLPAGRQGCNHPRQQM